MCSISLWFLCILSYSHVEIHIQLHNIVYINTWLLLHAWRTCCTFLIFSYDFHDLINDHDLINISISSHHQVNEINYQCLKNTFVFVSLYRADLSHWIPLLVVNDRVWRVATDSEVMRSSSATRQISIYDDWLFRVFSMHQYWNS